MQYIMTFIWSVMLVSMLNYVVSSVLGADFNFMDGVYLSLAFSVLVFIFTAVIPKKAVGETEVEHH